MKKAPLVLSALLLVGCWTFNETTYPSVQMTPASESAKQVLLSGFEATLTEWQAIHGYRSVYVHGSYDCRYWSPGYFETVPSVDYLPQYRSTDMFARRAQDIFEKAGFTVASTGADYRIDVRFEGPLASTSSDLAKMFAWNICTLFFCDYDTAHWIAKLRIYDAKTGKRVFDHDYEQTYETCVFGLIPLFGAVSSSATGPTQMQIWCLSALTDRAVADAMTIIK